MSWPRPGNRCDCRGNNRLNVKGMTMHSPSESDALLTVDARAKLQREFGLGGGALLEKWRLFLSAGGWARPGKRVVEVLKNGRAGTGRPDRRWQARLKGGFHDDRRTGPGTGDGPLADWSGFRPGRAGLRQGP